MGEGGSGRIAAKKLWKNQLNLHCEETTGLWRCRGRMGNSDLTPTAREPILLDKEHHLASLIATEAHRKVGHNGVKQTLTEIRARYWLVKGRQFVRRLVYHCPTCRKQEGAP